MESNLYSISKIFTERLFRIPDYQRGYAWTEKQLKDFWTDLNQLEIGKNHYTGVLTLEDIPEEKIADLKDDLWIVESKSYHPYYIVDGQQRLTTSIILIQCIIEKSQEYKFLNYTPINDIKKKFVFDSKDDGVSRSYIFGYEKDNPSYEHLKTKIFGEESDTSETKQETVYTQNLDFAKEYFITKLIDLDKNDIEVIYKKLTQNFKFNIYTISSDIDVFVAFETMNNRGKILSHLELLKNRLIFLTTQVKAGSHDKSKLRARVNECWKSIYHNLGRNKNNPLNDDEFLVNHFLIYFGNEIYKNVDRISHMHLRHRYGYNRFDYGSFLLETKFTTLNLKNGNIDLQSINKYVSNLKSSVDFWFKIHNPKISGLSAGVCKWLDKINRLGISPVAPTLMTYFKLEKSANKRLRFLIALERVMFIWKIGRNTFDEMDMSYTNWLGAAVRLNTGEVKPDEALKKMESFSAKPIQQKERREYVYKTFGENGFYKWKGINYFLYEYDLSLQEGSKTNRSKLAWEDFSSRDYKSVEHIYPQNGRKPCWTDQFKHLNTKERKQLKNSLGNLLPLSQPKNSSFQNKCFSDKVGNNDNTIGFKYGCYSEIEVANSTTWGYKEIKDRGLKLLGFMENRWNIQLGSEQEKLKMLGLSLIDKKFPLKKKKNAANTAATPTRQ